MKIVFNESAIRAAAAAIANARAGRRGSPPISNVLEVLEKLQPRSLFDDVMADAKAALEAAATDPTAIYVMGWDLAAPDLSAVKDAQRSSATGKKVKPLD